MEFKFRKQKLVRFPKKVYRSELRLFLGKLFFQWKRTLRWLWERNHFATNQFNFEMIEFEYPISVFQHHSPIYRKLKDVPMYLQENKKVNLSIALQRLDGIIVKPNQVFSFWYLVGKPTKRKGYLPGMQLKNGSFVERTGGGLCQLANLLYWMTLHTPLTIKERWRHSFDIFPDSNRTLPFGSGATLSYNYIDLQIQNTTKQTFALHLWIQDGELFGEWRTEFQIPFVYKIYESYHAFHAEPYGGYTRRNTIRRKVISRTTKEEVDDHLVTENIAWMMYEPLLESNDRNKDSYR